MKLKNATPGLVVEGKKGGLIGTVRSVDKLSGTVNVLWSVFDFEVPTPVSILRRYK